jgi:hypothetical protein
MINDADLRRTSGGTAEGGKDGKSTAEDWSATAPDARVLVESTARTSRKTRLQPKQKAATLQGTHQRRPLRQRRLEKQQTQIRRRNYLRTLRCSWWK